MSVVEGGPFVCNIDGFTTSSYKEWNEHCPGHVFENGSTNCNKCGKHLIFKGLPFHPFDDAGHKNISLTCSDCQVKIVGNAVITEVVE